MPSGSISIMNKHLKNESDVSHEFYHQGRLRGWDLWTQVKYESAYHRSGYFIVDCIVGINAEPICAIEFKREGKGQPKPWSRQGRAYRDLDLPVLFCLGSSGLQDAIERTEDLVLYGETSCH